LSELNEWMNTQTKYKDLNCIESFIPKINLDDYKILFDEVLGTSIFRVSPIGLNREILIPIFLKVVKLFKDVIETNLGKTGWMEVFLTKIKPYLLNHWNYLLKLELLKPLFNIYLN